MKNRLLLGLAALPVLAFSLMLAHTKAAHAQLNAVKNSPVFASLLLKGSGDRQVYRVTVKNGHLAVNRCTEPTAAAGETSPRAHLASNRPGAS